MRQVLRLNKLTGWKRNYFCRFSLFAKLNDWLHFNVSLSVIFIQDGLASFWYSSVVLSLLIRVIYWVTVGRWHRTDDRIYDKVVLDIRTRPLVKKRTVNGEGNYSRKYINTVNHQIYFKDNCALQINIVIQKAFTKRVWGINRHESFYIVNIIRFLAKIVYNQQVLATTKWQS